jgi:hypothetical protein
LQHEVQEDDGFAEVMQEVAQTAADRTGQDLLVGERDRSNDCLVDRLNDFERFGVEFLERVVRLARRPVTTISSGRAAGAGGWDSGGADEAGSVD